MKHGMLRALSAAVLVSGLTLAADQPTRADPMPHPATAQDSHDLIFFGDASPVLMRLHIRIDGKPVRHAWDDFLDDLFRYLDRDGNGVLSQQELQRVPQPKFLLSLLGGNLSDTSSAARRSTVGPQVSLIPGQVTRAGLASYYRLSGVEPFAAFIQDKTKQAEMVTDVLFKTLDLNGDGKLSKNELLKAASSLCVLDVNDDELISIQEILPSPEGNEGLRPAQGEAFKPLSQSTAFLLLAPDVSPTQLASILLDRYDKDQNQRLSRIEMALEPRIFDQLDRNHDGELNADELAQFLERQPIALELIVRLSVSTSQGSIDVYDPLRAAAMPTPVPATNDRPLVIRLPGARIAAQAGSGMRAALPSIRQSLLSEFETADVEKRGYLENRQIQGNALLATLFPAAEGESRLSREEYAALVDVLDKAGASSAVLTITDEGRSLFELLNRHQDGRLRQRELKWAWARLAPWDRDGDGQIARAEIPHQFHLRFSQGPSADAVQIAEGVMLSLTNPQRKLAEKSRGPLWFQRMDRNSDGEISLREWLGSKEDFQRMDTNSDGVISLEEAERADAEFRKPRRPEAPSPQKGHYAR